MIKKETRNALFVVSLAPMNEDLKSTDVNYEDTYLPNAVGDLKFVRDLRPGKTRTPELLQCPYCGTF